VPTIHQRVLDSYLCNEGTLMSIVLVTKSSGRADSIATQLSVITACSSVAGTAQRCQVLAVQLSPELQEVALVEQ
jgi:hypothetical protein